MKGTNTPKIMLEIRGGIFKGSVFGFFTNKIGVLSGINGGWLSVRDQFINEHSLA